MTIFSRICAVLVAFVPAWTLAQSSHFQCNPGLIYKVIPCAPGWDVHPEATRAASVAVARIEPGMTASEVVRIMGLPDQVLLQGTAARPMQNWIYGANGDFQSFVLFSHGVVFRGGVTRQTVMPGVSLGRE